MLLRLKEKPVWPEAPKQVFHGCLGGSPPAMSVFVKAEEKEIGHSLNSIHLGPRRVMLSACAYAVFPSHLLK
ncbi:hypothetical protein E2C01_029855 [Portunus trituberculatus]|uniref:Uncharacterized protein n=1 Tax=Portunus trituberculatus TaxID=210409 RepID=A0A5B7ET45_PORTR|nr:hypothetical protein [Portunus trituberculatus]